LNGLDLIHYDALLAWEGLTRAILCEKCSRIDFKHIEECELIVKEPEQLAMRQHDDWDLTKKVYNVHSKYREFLEKMAVQDATSARC
jgi:hypothetical protein